MSYEYPPEENTSSFPYRPEEGVTPPRIKHSGPGIASFIMNLVAIAGYVSGLSIFFVTLYHLGLTAPDEQEVLNQPGFLAGIFILMAGSVVNVAGIITAIIGLAMKDRKKVFAVLGLIFGLLPLLLMIILFIIGVSAAGSNL